MSIITHFTDGLSKEMFKSYISNGNIITYIKRMAMLK